MFKLLNKKYLIYKVEVNVIVRNINEKIFYGEIMSCMRGLHACMVLTQGFNSKGMVLFY